MGCGGVCLVCVVVVSIGLVLGVVGGAVRVGFVVLVFFLGGCRVRPGRLVAAGCWVGGWLLCGGEWLPGACWCLGP